MTALHGYPRLVLGAWGCGVFRNDPALVAEAFRALPAGLFERVFERMVFGILDRKLGTRAAFECAFAGETGPGGATGPAGTGRAAGPWTVGTGSAARPWAAGAVDRPGPRGRSGYCQP
ncbi:TIGR02452 family protein [Streptomyces xanthophaeus]|uniref:TIGR02452 family protein n=1 Tax=Streptomyces xanthophaeus TaxID=67385 RepID=UPI003687CC9A